MDKITLITDGSCYLKEGASGGWAAILKYENGDVIELSGGTMGTTNNRMEMIALIKGLEAIKKKSIIHIITDSKYLMDGYTKWLPNWKRTGWRRQIKNKDLWFEIDKHLSKHIVTWQWVKGHSGHSDNMRADKLASKARLKVLKEHNG